MYYSLEEAKNLVIEAGHRLLEEGLVARTWGNISARISEEEFVITPSGRGYEDLQPKDLVIVKVKDASYESDIKPSSEKILHAACYRNRPDCSFIIHTHQFYATAISVSGESYEFAPCAGYGFPGTEGLAQQVEKSVKLYDEKDTFLMQRHGALMLGKDCEDAFDKATTLETKSKEVFFSALKNIEPSEEISGYYSLAGVYGKIPAYIDDFTQILGPSVDGKKTVSEICSGVDAWAEEQILYKNCASMLYAKAVDAKPMGFADRCIQRIVYLTKYSKLKEKNK